MSQAVDIFYFSVDNLLKGFNFFPRVGELHENGSQFSLIEQMIRPIRIHTHTHTQPLKVWGLHFDDDEEDRHTHKKRVRPKNGIKFYSFRIWLKRKKKKNNMNEKKKCWLAAKLKAEKIEVCNFHFNKELKCTCFDNVCCCCYKAVFFPSFEYIFFPCLLRLPLSNSKCARIKTRLARARSLTLSLFYSHIL